MSDYMTDEWAPGKKNEPGHSIVSLVKKQQKFKQMLAANNREYSTPMESQRDEEIKQIQ